MEGLIAAYTPQEWIISGVILLALGVVFMVFSKSADKTGGAGKGRITGNRAQKAKASGGVMLVIGILMAGFGICSMMGVFQ